MNLVEFLIFGFATAVFFNSAYQLFYGWEELRPATLGSMDAPAQKTNARSPAALGQSILYLDFDCQKSPIQVTTSAHSLRLKGKLCSEGSSKARLLKTEVTNVANKEKGHVFIDSNDGSFSTNYIGLNNGENPIQIQFIYDGGNVVPKTLTVFKN